MWSSYARLPQIRIPTLILHGEEDHVLPPENGRIIARRIPGAEYVELPQAGHILGTDQPEACIVELSRFLSRVESDAAERPSPAGLEPAESRAERPIGRLRIADCSVRQSQNAYKHHQHFAVAQVEFE